MQIEVEVKGQRIKRINSPGSVEGTLNYLTCHFTFDGAEWENTVKTAYFQNPASGEKYPKILADDGTCTVPWEALTDQGFVKFSVAGERENYRITTGIESFYNSETVYGGNPSEPPTPDQYDQMIALAQETKEIAESVRSDADAGKFDGEPGKPGDPGKDGVSPAAKVEQTDDGAVITVTDATGATTAKLKNGKDGNPGQDATDEQVQAAVDAYMEEHPIQGDTEDIIKLAIKEEASGAVPIVVTDSADMGVQDLEMQGWTEQAQYEGKNLFDYSPMVNQDGYVPSDYATPHQIPPFHVEQGKKYVLITKGTVIDSDYSSVYFGEDDLKYGSDDTIIIGIDTGVKAFDGVEKKFIMTATKTCDITKCIVHGTSYYKNGYKVEEFGVFHYVDGTSETYEPYTGGAPSPSPDYKQDVENAGNYNEETQKYEYQVKLTGANLFDPAKLTGGENVEYNGVQCYKYTDNSTNFTYVDDFAENTQYCFSVMVLSSKGNEEKATSISIVYTDGTRSAIYLSYNQLMNVVSSANKTVAMITGNDSWSVARYIDLTMTTLGIGTEPVPYQPYKEQTVTLTSDRQLAKWDKLEKRNGQWGWVYKSNHLDLTGTEDFVLYETTENTNKFVLYNIPTEIVLNYNTNSGYSNTFLYDPDVLSSEENGTYRIYTSVSTRWLAISIDKSYTLDIFKDFLQEKYEEGNRFIFWYETAEETFVPLSEAEQEALNALHTYYPTTSVSNDAGCEMTIKYIADTKAYIDSKIAAIQAAVVNRI